MIQSLFGDEFGKSIEWEKTPGHYLFQYCPRFWGLLRAGGDDTCVIGTKLGTNKH